MGQQIRVLDADFEPKRRGRRPVVDITELLDAATSHPGQWVSQELSEREAGSVTRQLKEREEFEWASTKAGDDRRVVYVRIG